MRLVRHLKCALEGFVNAAHGFFIGPLRHWRASVVDQDLVVHDPLFQQTVGRFYITWSNVEAETSYIIGQLLGLSHDETHLLTTRMEFSRKAALIRDLVVRKKHPKASEIKRALNKLQNNSKRNVFAHSALVADYDKIYFIERDWKHEFVADVHEFTLNEFGIHVRDFILAAVEFSDAAGITGPGIHEFLQAALFTSPKSRYERR
jgi:hypothetical protein